MSCVSHAFVSVHCCLVVTCWERTDLLALNGDVYCIFVTCPCGILGQVWFLIVSFPDLCLLCYLTVHSMSIQLSDSLCCTICIKNTKYFNIRDSAQKTI